MLEIIERYTELNYYQKSDIERELDSSIAHVVWDETIRYRNQFRFDVTLRDQSYYLILCRHVLWKTTKCEALVWQYVHRNKYHYDDMEDNIWKLIMHEFDSLGYKDSRVWLKTSLRRLGYRDSLCAEKILFMDQPILLRLFLCIFFDQSQEYVLQRLLLIKEDLCIFYDILQDLETQVVKSVNEVDVTCIFLQYLDQIELKISDRMVSLNHDKKSNVHMTSFHELKECFPQLRDEQIRFYMEHRNKQHYYTIQQYIAFCKVCYETARNSLDQLVDMHWYQKHKLGKKYVYFIE